ncbi:hypothetical protein [Methylacidimicrobium tartarophylax]|uniref:hypothetical protein n=1 Tax=Methylacidimicrobium tartarophylax TaxID=1041768 RepID=UPI001FE26DE4|nr:hypothetical protein [Methylacidimicrobium tartarophylax]
MCRRDPGDPSLPGRQGGGDDAGDALAASLIARDRAAIEAMDPVADWLGTQEGVSNVHDLHI